MTSINYRELFPPGEDVGDRRRVHCWHHDDDTASLDINLKTGVYKCRSCGEAGNAKRYVTEILGEDPVKHGIKKIISEAEVDRYHQALIANPEIRAYLEVRRSVRLKTLKEWKIGYEEDTNRIVFPIRNDSGECINLRKYLPNAPDGTPKTISVKGFGGAHLYPLTIIQQSEHVLLCAGETDWLVATSQGLPAITCTSGEEYWNDEYTERLRGKQVTICYDTDEVGVRGGQAIARRLHGVARLVKVIDLRKAGLNEEQFPKGDLSDYFNKLIPKPTVKDFLHLIRSTPIYQPEEVLASIIDPLKDEEVYEVDFPRAILAQYAGRRVSFNAHVQGMDKVPYIVPKDMVMTCGENAGKLCERCACAGKGGRVDKAFSVDDPKLLSMIRCTELQQKGFIREIFGIPVRCPQYQIIPTSFINIEEVHLVREVGAAQELSEEEEDKYATRLGYFVYPQGEEGLKWNSSYVMQARTQAEPTKQYAVHLVYAAQQKENDLSNFELSAERVEELKKKLNPKKWIKNEIAARLQDICQDAAERISRIYGRYDLQLIVDLTYHSCMYFEWDSKPVRGWLDVLLLGDTRQGKSETVITYRRHTKLGDRVDCSRATIAGLLGGAHEMMKGHWTIEWGAIPLSDRMLVVLEEIKVLEPDKIGALKEVRSSGIAEVTAIRRDKTFARTRKIWISNPRSSRKMETYSYGIEAVRELIGNPEDIARFDCIVTVADTEEEVPHALLHQLRDDSGERQQPKYDSQCYRDTILFAWSRHADDILIDERTRRLGVEHARRFTETYDDEFPLVQASDFRFKLFRIAIACAARTFSVDDTGTKLIVRECHVEWAAQFLEELFAKRSFGYAQYSKDQKKAKTLDNAHEIKAALLAVPYPEQLRDSVLRARYFNRTNVANWAGIDKDAAETLMGVLERNRAVHPYDNSKYYKSPAFIKLLRRMQEDNESNVEVRD